MTHRCRFVAKTIDQRKSAHRILFDGEKSALGRICARKLLIRVHRPDKTEFSKKVFHNEPGWKRSPCHQRGKVRYVAMQHKGLQIAAIVAHGGRAYHRCTKSRNFRHGALVQRSLVVGPTGGRTSYPLSLRRHYSAIHSVSRSECPTALRSPTASTFGWQVEVN